MAWKLAKCLTRLRDQINAESPNRNKVSDGTISDAAHRARVSDHNPDSRGIVTAMDITHDPPNRVDGSVLSEALIKDPRTKYVIFAGRIWKARTGKWETYRGPNSHHHHLHLSVKPDLVDNVEPWPLSLTTIPSKPLRPVLRKGDRGEAVRELQVKLRKWANVSVDGIFGIGTENAVKYFQRMEGLDPDGKVGPATYQKLGL